MSIINQVLKDLDRQGANVAVPMGVTAVNRVEIAAPRRLWIVLAVIVLALAAWWFWSFVGDSSSNSSTSANAPANAPANALANTPANSPTNSPASSLANTAAESAPTEGLVVDGLRMSEQLGAASKPVNEMRDTPQVVVDPAIRTQIPPSVGVPQPRLEMGLTPSQPPSQPTSQPTRLPNPPAAESSKPVTRNPAIRDSETRKPEVVKSNQESSRIVKEIKPPTSQVQAEEAWRQSSRLLEQGRNHDALELLEKALRLDPLHMAARQSLVALLLSAQAPADSAGRAETLLREGLSLHVNEPWYPRSLAQLQLQNGDAAQAAMTLKAGLDQHADASNWSLYASTLAKLGKPAEAAQAYREALQMNPAQGNWWIGFAVAQEQSGEIVEAVAAYQRALQTRLSKDLRDFAQRKTRELGAR
jgi:MSHA biogenesis protein MshN